MINLLITVNFVNETEDDVVLERISMHEAHTVIRAFMACPSVSSIVCTISRWEPSNPK